MHDGPVRHQGARDGLEKSYADRFSRLLREELEAAGHPTYQSIANRGGISKSAVSDAMRGVRLPSARTVCGIMTGMDRPGDRMLAQRDRLAQSLAASTRRKPAPPRGQDSTGSDTAEAASPGPPGGSASAGAPHALAPYAFAANVSAARVSETTGPQRDAAGSVPGATQAAAPADASRLPASSGEPHPSTAAFPGLPSATGAAAGAATGGWGAEHGGSPKTPEPSTATDDCAADAAVPKSHATLPDGTGYSAGATIPNATGFGPQIDAPGGQVRGLGRSAGASGRHAVVPGPGAAAGEHGAGASTRDVAGAGGNPGARFGRRGRGFLPALAAMLACGIVIGAITAWNALASASPTTADTVAPTTGTSLADSGCMGDGVEVADAVRENGVQLEMWLSHECRAVWGVVRRGDGLDRGNVMDVAIFPQEKPDASWTQRHSARDAATAYTGIVVLPEHHARSICLRASLERSGQAKQTVDPLCVSLG